MGSTTHPIAADGGDLCLCAEGGAIEFYRCEGNPGRTAMRPEWALNHLDLCHAPNNMTEYPTPTLDIADAARKAKAAHIDPANPVHQNYNHVLETQCSHDQTCSLTGVGLSA